MHLRLCFCRFHVTRLLRLRFQLGDLHLFLLDLLFRAKSLVLLFLQQEPFKSLGIFRGKLQVPQQYFPHDDSVTRQPRRDGIGGLGPQFFSFGGKNLSGHVIRRELPVDRGHYRRHHLLTHWLRQIRMNRFQPLGVQPVSDGHRQPNVQPFARLHRQQVTFLFGIFGRHCRIHLLARVVNRDGIHQRRNQVHARIQRAGTPAPKFADAYSRRPVRDHHKALREQHHQGGRR